MYGSRVCVGPFYPSLVRNKQGLKQNFYQKNFRNECILACPCRKTDFFPDLTDILPNAPKTSNMFCKNNSSILPNNGNVIKNNT